MLITNEQMTTIIQLFRWVNPSIDYEVHVWFNGYTFKD